MGGTRRQGCNAAVSARIAVAMKKEEASSMSRQLAYRPVVRGPQAHLSATELAPEEQKRADAIFKQHDKTKSGEVDQFAFYRMCEALDVPLDSAVARAWLSGRSADEGVTIDDFKCLYARILAAQTPAVRQAMSAGPLDYAAMRRTEGQMRAAFNKHAVPDGGLSMPCLRDVLLYLSYPDNNGDKFDRVVGD